MKYLIFSGAWTQQSLEPMCLPTGAQIIFPKIIIFIKMILQFVYFLTEYCVYST